MKRKSIINFHGTQELTIEKAQNAEMQLGEIAVKNSLIKGESELYVLTDNGETQSIDTFITKDATEQWVNEQGFLKTHQDISHLAEKSEIPTKVSDLEESSELVRSETLNNFATKDEITEINSTITDNEYVIANAFTYIDNRITSLEEIDFDNLVNKDELPTVPTKVSELENDSNFIRLVDIPVQEILNEYAKKDELPTVPTKVSELENDSNFITLEWINSKNYVSEQKLSDKQDKLVSGTNIKTINGESIIGEGDIVISAGSESTSVDWEDVQNKPEISITDVGDLKIKSNAFVDIKGEYGITLTGPVYFEENTNYDGIVKNNTQLNWNSYGIQLIDTNDDGILSISCTGDGSKFLSNDGTYKEISGGSSAYPLINHGTSDTTFTLTPNTFHVWDNVDALTLTIGNKIEGVANEYIFQFTSDTEPTTLILPDSIKFNTDFTVEENKIYQISILNGLGTVMSWENNLIKLITFTVDGVEYQAEEGMTWEEWCNSEYNTDGFYISNNLTYKGGKFIYNYGDSYTVILNNGSYTLYQYDNSSGGSE